MEIVETFFAEFWSPLIGATIAMLLVGMLRLAGITSRVPFLDPNAFPELSTRTKLERRRLLARAGTLAYQHWRPLIPLAVFAVCFAMAGALAQALPKAMTLPDSTWLRAGICGVCVLPGFWLTRRLTTHYFRPFVRTCVEQTGAGA